MESLNLTKRTLFLLLSYILILVLMTSVNASEIRSLNSFSSGSPAIAADVNSNFTAVTASVNDNNSRIAQLEQLVATLQAELTAVKNNSVLELDNVLTYATDNNGYPTALFSGVNIQVINGVDQSTPNGVGNVIIGYNNNRLSLTSLCADGQYTQQLTCEGAGEIWSVSHKTGSHNLVAGTNNSYSQTGGVVFGLRNGINRTNASVTGGSGNIASGLYSSVSGGSLNNVSGDYSSISGGTGNDISGSTNNASISGGSNNRIRRGAHESSISGGALNTTWGLKSSISGGSGNDARGNGSSISGGSSNETTGVTSSISGGYRNIASGLDSSVSGGSNRVAADTLDWVAGTLFEDN